MSGTTTSADRQLRGTTTGHRDRHRINEELALIDQPGIERVRGEGRPADGQVAGGGCLHVADRIGVEAALEPRVGGRDDVQRRGVDDLVRRLPDVRDVPDSWTDEISSQRQHSGCHDRRRLRAGGDSC